MCYAVSMQSLWLGLAVACALSGCAKQARPPAAPAASADAEAAAGSPKDPEAAKLAIEGGALVLDVRTEAEFAEGHLEGAINVPLQDLARRLIDLEALVAGDRAKPIVLYCGSGERAGKAKRKLEAEGYTGTINGGGLADLE